MVDFKHRLDELVKLRYDERYKHGVTRSTYRKAVVLAEELHAEMERLRGELLMAYVDRVPQSELEQLRAAAKFSPKVDMLQKIKKICDTADGWEDGETFYKDAIMQIRDIINVEVK